MEAGGRAAASRRGRAGIALSPGWENWERRGPCLCCRTCVTSGVTPELAIAPPPPPPVCSLAASGAAVTPPKFPSPRSWVVAVAVLPATPGQESHLVRFHPLGTPRCCSPGAPSGPSPPPGHHHSSTHPSKTFLCHPQRCSALQPSASPGIPPYSVSFLVPRSPTASLLDGAAAPRTPLSSSPLPAAPPAKRTSTRAPIFVPLWKKYIILLLFN